MKTLLPIGLVTLLLLACSTAPLPQKAAVPITPQRPEKTVAYAALASLTDATVVSVGDGDTVRAQVGSETITIRMACIDAPEMAQPQGQESADRLQALLPRGATVQLYTVDTDRYGRTVAEVYRDNALVNLVMVQEGRAVVYYDYLDGCAQNRDRYIAAEATAKDQRLAFWGQDDPILPWDWRSGNRPSDSPQPAALAQNQPQVGNCDPSYPGVCIPPAPPDLDCGDISERRFTVLPPDPHGFDGDRDGIGCES